MEALNLAQIKVLSRRDYDRVYCGTHHVVTFNIGI